MAKATKAPAADWKSLKHARGSAAKVPEQIETLAAPKPDKRLKAFQALGEALYSDRQFYPGGVAAVPLLVDLVKNEAAPERHRAFMLLANIATSNHALFVATGVASAPADLRALLDGAEAKAARKAVLDGADAYLAALDAKEEKVRSGAAFLLAFLPEAADGALPALRKRADAEKDPFAKASALLAVGQLARGKDDRSDAARFAKARAASEPAIVQGAAALATVHALGDASPDDMAGAVEAFFVLRQVDTEAFFWRWGRTDQLATDVFRAAGERARKIGSRAIRHAIQELGQVPLHDLRLAEWPSAVLALHFTQDKLGQYLEPSALSADQREALVDLSHRNLFGWFGASGVPAFLPDRRRWLGLDPAGPMEKEIEAAEGGAKQKKPVYRVLLAMHAANATAEAVDEALRKGLDAVGLLGVYAELSVFAYEIRRALPQPQFLRALHEADKAAADWAASFATELLGFPTNRARPAEAQIAALWPLVRAGRSIGPEMDPLVPVGGPPEEVRAILSALPADRRDALVLAKLEMLSTNAPPTAIRLALPLLEVVPRAVPIVARVVGAIQAQFAMTPDDTVVVGLAREAAKKNAALAKALEALPPPPAAS